MDDRKLEATVAPDSMLSSDVLCAILSPKMSQCEAGSKPAELSKTLETIRNQTHSEIIAFQNQIENSLETFLRN